MPPEFSFFISKKCTSYKGQDFEIEASKQLSSEQFVHKSIEAPTLDHLRLYPFHFDAQPRNQFPTRALWLPVTLYMSFLVVKGFLFYKYKNP
jgi:hypothetical protein